MKENEAKNVGSYRSNAMSSQKILIIEDDPVIRTQLQKLLTGNGYEAFTAEDFSQVIGTVKRVEPHLILLDIRLPGEDGFSLCSRIRAFSEVPVIFVTSCNTDIDELNSIMVGGDAFITKPYHTAILLAKIALLIKRAYPEGRSESLCWQGATLGIIGSP